MDKFFPEIINKPEETNKKLKVMWMGVGTEDFLYQQAVTFDKLLTDKKITHKYMTTPGGHTWMNARTYLSETLQLFFK